MALRPKERWETRDTRILLALFHERTKTKGEGRSPLASRLPSDAKKSRGKLRAAVQELADRGFVRVASEDGGQRDVLERARGVELTDEAYEYVLRSLTLSPHATAPGAPVAAWEARLPAEGEGGLRAPPAEPRADASAGAPARRLDVEIVRAFLARERAEHGYVPIHAVRRALPHATREAFDRALLDLQKQDFLYLVKLNDPRDIPPDQIEDGLADPIRGRLFFISRGGKPWPAEPRPSTALS